MTIKIRTHNISFWYNDHQVLNNISIEIPEHTITAITGPSGNGKSTFLTVLNRLWEEIPGARISGLAEIELQGNFIDTCDPSLPVRQLRRRVGMVFQQPNPLPMSIRKNIVFPLTIAGKGKQKDLEKKIRNALKRALLWDEVKDRLNDDARKLSGGQQQRLCIARALVLEPSVLLLDEPTASIDPAACAGIEQLLLSLKANCTLVMVTHYLDQVRRIADTVLTMHEGQLFPQNDSAETSPCSQTEYRLGVTEPFSSTQSQTSCFPPCQAGNQKSVLPPQETVSM